MHFKILHGTIILSRIIKMDFSYLHNKSILIPQKLLDFGFVKDKSDDCEFFILKRNLTDSEFYVRIEISEVKISAQVFENETDERYALLDVPSANGAFVGDLREKVRLLMEEIQNSCFETTDIRQKYVDFIKSRFDVDQEYPWEDEASVFRCPNGKWFGLLMRIRFKKLGIESDEPVWVVNLKADADKIPGLVNKKSIFPAWHMNKKYWITIILTTITDFEQLCKLTERSYELVIG